MVHKVWSCSKNCDISCIFWEFPNGAQGVVMFKYVHHCAQGFVAVHNLHILACALSFYLVS